MSDIPGWAIANSNEEPWQTIGNGIAMKMLGMANGRMLALFKFEAGYEGGSHHHEDAEFSYVLEGSIVSNGVVMEAGCGYAASAGTDHTEFRSETGGVVVSVFKAPS